MVKRSWVILELTSKGEREARQGQLSQILARYSGVPRCDIYVPIVKVGQSEPICLMEGYIFVRTGHPSHVYWDLKETEMVRNVISEIDPKTGLISKGVVTDSDLKKMILKADSLGGKYKEGSKVQIKAGAFEGLEGTVIDVISPSAKSEIKEITEITEEDIRKQLSQYSILIELRSAEVIITLDCFSIEGA